MCDGCRRGRNEFAGRVQKHHVRFSFHRNGHIKSFLRSAALLVGTLWVAGYAKDAIVGACHRTIDGQEHKISWRAGPEQDKIFPLRVTACREHARQPLSRQAISLGSFTVAGDFVLMLIHLKSLGSELQES